LDEEFVIDEGGGILRTQVWHYPSRVECIQCHTAAGGFALGFNTAQLNRDHDYDGMVTNQIAALSLAGYFNTNVTGIHTLRSLAHPTNQTVSVEYRARSYFAANCVQCHQPGGPAHGSLWDARITTTTANAGIVNGPLATSSDTNVHVITPGSLADSELLRRISIRGPGQMPPIDSTVVDTQAVALISAWITNDLPNHQSFEDWQIAFFGSTNAPDADPNADPDNDGANNRLENLTHSNPTNSLDFWAIGAALSNDMR
jgi:mono/diheme cytochrome c family protein